MSMPIFCQTIGLEIEVTDVNLSHISLPYGWTTTSDASVESDIDYFNGIPIVNNTTLNSLVLGNNIQGGEILSSIIDTNTNYIQSLKSLCSSLISYGEPYQSERAGLHVHLSFTRPGLEVLKSIIKLGCYLEDVFFLLGGMGYDFRGHKNDCSYCRPITTPGPQVINDDYGRLYPCFVVDDLLESKTIKEFQIRLGDHYNLGDNKYVPIRYHWLNLWNLWGNKQTLEFRVFNHTLKPRYIEVAIEICKAFGDAVMYYSYQPEELDALSCNSVYDHRSREAIVDTFISFANSRLESRIIDLALRMMENTSIHSIRFPKIPFYFHLRFHRNGNRSPTLWLNHPYRPSICYDSDQIAEPYFEDIHNLRENSPRNRPSIMPPEELDPIFDQPITVDNSIQSRILGSNTVSFRLNTNQEEAFGDSTVDQPIEDSEDEVLNFNIWVENLMGQSNDRLEELLNEEDETNLEEDE